MNNTYTINFDDIESFIDNHFFNDSKSKEIIKKAGFTETQIKVINTLIPVIIEFSALCLKYCNSLLEKVCFSLNTVCFFFFFLLKLSPRCYFLTFICMLSINRLLLNIV